MQYIEFIEDALKLSPYAAKYALVLISREPLLNVRLMTRLHAALVNRSKVDEPGVRSVETAEHDEAMAVAFVQLLLKAPTPALDL